MPSPKRVNLGHIVPRNNRNWWSFFQLLCHTGIYTFSLRGRDFIQKDFLECSFNNTIEAVLFGFPFLHVNVSLLARGKLSYPVSELMNLTKRFPVVTSLPLWMAALQTTSRGIFTQVWPSQKVFFCITLNQYCIFLFKQKSLVCLG